MNSRLRFVAAVALGGAAMLFPRAAQADVVRLTNGRTMRVETCQFSGQTAVLILRGGGQITLARDEVAELLPDELPFARVIAARALAGSPTASRSRLSTEAVRLLIDQVAARVGLNPRLAHALVHAESNYQPLAVSPKGAMGLMQIMPDVVRRYALADPFDPEQNLEAGMRHMRALLERFDLRRALAAYNAGPTAVTRYGGIPPYQETRLYVSRIITELR
ncbi:MAG: lytic transglycosylase domain-containing protein [Vicinamibacterales bacterium]